MWLTVTFPETSCTTTPGQMEMRSTESEKKSSWDIRFHSRGVTPRPIAWNRRSSCVSARPGSMAALDAHALVRAAVAGSEREAPHADGVRARLAAARRAAPRPLVGRGVAARDAAAQRVGVLVLRLPVAVVVPAVRSHLREPLGLLRVHVGIVVVAVAAVVVALSRVGLVAVAVAVARVGALVPGHAPGDRAARAARDRPAAGPARASAADATRATRAAARARRRGDRGARRARRRPR